MEEMFLRDLANATEIVLSARRRVRRTQPAPTSHRHRRRRSGSAGRVVAGALGVGNAVGAAITNHRALGPAEAKLMVSAGAILLTLAAVGLFWPRVLSVPLSLVGIWTGVVLVHKAWKLRARPHDPPRAVPFGRGGP